MIHLTAWLAENMAILIILVGQMLFIAFVGYMIKRKLAHLGKIKNLELQMQWVLKYRKGELEYRKGYEQGMHERITLLENRVSDTNDRLAGISSFSGYDEFRND